MTSPRLHGDTEKSTLQALFLEVSGFCLISYLMFYPLYVNTNHKPASLTERRSSAQLLGYH